MILSSFLSTNGCTKLVLSTINLVLQFGSHSYCFRYVLQQSFVFPMHLILYIMAFMFAFSIVCFFVRRVTILVSFIGW